MKRLIVIGLLALGACATNLPNGGGDLASSDLAGADFARADFSSTSYDLAGADLAGYSNVGEPCGGFTAMPKQCLPGLVCVSAQIPDAPGTCANPDAGMCQPNGQPCTTNADCCSQNCITRSGTCCIPGGCP